MKLRREVMNNESKTKKCGNRWKESYINKRLMRYIFQLIKSIIFCVYRNYYFILSTSIFSSLFMKTLLDDYVEPLIQSANKDLHFILCPYNNGSHIYGWGYRKFYLPKALGHYFSGTIENIRRDLFLICKTSIHILISHSTWRYYEYIYQ